LFFTFKEIKSCDRKREEVAIYLRATVFWALLNSFLSGNEIKNTGKMMEGIMPVPPSRPCA